MKRIYAILLLVVLYSCTEKKEELAKKNLLENLSFEVDTVIIDSGEDIFNLSMGIRDLDLSQDQQRLFYFENLPPKLLEVDLEHLKLVSKTDFEQEGPNGIGNFVGEISVGPNDQIFAMGISEIGLFDKNGKKLKNLKIKPSGIDPTLAGNFIALFINSMFDFDTKRIYSWPNFEDSKKNALFSMAIESESAKLFDAPELDIVREYSIKGEDNGMFMFSGQQVNLLKHESKILLSCSAMGSVYEFDPLDESMKLIEITHQIVSNRLTGVVITSVDSEKAFREETKKVNAQIRYQKLAWEPVRKLFMRFGMKEFMGDTRADTSTYEIYLFAYDKDFNVLGETKIEGLDNVPTNYFWKDGKLWSYVNVEDELGFAVMDFKF